ncbi:hypothetical protein ABB37_09998 [Leptomonas pyrrhocoris]|uniref:Uncharacterized protein n=1 Tax=Leptomonas pyrrhocoris TaxID=157538 RepID=A0A0M9FPL4_LEPPY|nr:hypothetical protein ABB37_09998 [Leptomonas pyrrhocoris]KPA73296.1 hypothetical protein ABB37_09998 [Leptomonas pyrrhocoris]|eukprot:XP_015651735.1 hypothetical protein ABB37_09998 [Leptomonas pyrrhocoris]
MLEKAELPLHKSLFSTLDDGNALDDIPFLFSLDVESIVESTAATHFAQLRIPLLATVSSLEVNSVMFKTASGAASRKIYLMLQRLDFNDEPEGPPVPITITDATQCAVAARFKLKTNDHVRLILVQRGTGAGVREIVFNGFLLQSPESFVMSVAPPAALTSWTPGSFKLMEGERPVQTRKRSHSSEKQHPKDDEGEDEVPTLIYAPVIGGDDES